jgi:alpha-D-ribose 1-methylphosphonate 5-triphosphate diphosphatase
MDHTPGQRQWRDLALYRNFRAKRGQVWGEGEFEAHLADRQRAQATHVPKSREEITALAHRRSLPLASHDDTTLDDVEESHADGVTIAEFPTTIEAAERARQRGMAIVMGSPNIVLGRSHSGNVSARELMEHGLLDVLASDYVPSSLLQALFMLGERLGSLPKAVGLATANAAAAVGLGDRGRLAPGNRADLLRVRLVEGTPVITGVWVRGRSVVAGGR